jgi:hypothetical protein
MTFLLLPRIRKPLPLMTPELPFPTMLLLEPTSMGERAALSYVHDTLVPPSQVSPMVNWPAEVPPLHVEVLVEQQFPLVVPSVPVKSQVRSMTMVRAVLSVSHSLSLALLVSCYLLEVTLIASDMTHCVRLVGVAAGALPPPVTLVAKPVAAPLTWAYAVVPVRAIANAQERILMLSYHLTTSSGSMSGEQLKSFYDEHYAVFYTM